MSNMKPPGQQTSEQWFVVDGPGEDEQFSLGEVVVPSEPVAPVTTPLVAEWTVADGATDVKSAETGMVPIKDKRSVMIRKLGSRRNHCGRLKPRLWMSVRNLNGQPENSEVPAKCLLPPCRRQPVSPQLPLSKDKSLSPSCLRRPPPQWRRVVVRNARYSLPVRR